MTNPLDAERASLNNLSGRRAAPDRDFPRKVNLSSDLKELKKQCQNSGDFAPEH